MTPTFPVARIASAASAFLAVSAFAAGSAQAGEWVDWRASGHMAPILAEAGLLVVSPALHDGESIDPVASSCQARIYRPDQEEPAAIRPEHAIVCAIRTDKGSVATGTASLATVPIASWGNRFTKKVFQVEERAFATNLYRAMEKVHQAHGDTWPVSEMTVASPGEALVSRSYSLDVSRDPYSAAYLSCDGSWEYNRTTQGYDLYRMACVFLFPQD